MMQEIKKPEEQTPSPLFERYGNFQIPNDAELAGFYQGLNNEELLPSTSTSYRAHGSSWAKSFARHNSCFPSAVCAQIVATRK